MGSALLLERCDPETWLREVPEEEQNLVLAESPWLVIDPNPSWGIRHTMQRSI